MSNIPKARAIIKMVLALLPLDPAVRRHLHRALALMTRAPAIRRAKGGKTIITSNMRRQIHNLSKTDMTMFQIAETTGVRNQGRIHDVLTGKR